VPIYNYNVAATSKNFLELTGKAWSQKVVGIMAAAGGDLSYLAVMPIMTSLMIDYRCIMVPRYVYATGAAFTDDALTDEKILERMQTLADEFEHLSTKLA
jgi:FMN reductase